MQGFVRGVARIRDKVTKSEFERILHKCTSNEPGFPDKGLLKTVAAHTFNKGDYLLIIQHLEKKLQEKKEKWRKILKTLQLISFLVDHGNKRVVKDFNENIYLITMLQNFNFREGGKEGSVEGIDRGKPIQEVSKKLAKKLKDSKGVLKDPKYKKEISFIGKPAPDLASSLVVKKKKNKKTPNKKKAPIKKRGHVKKKKGSDILVEDELDAKFGEGFLSLDFEEDEEAVKQEEFLKKKAREKKAEKVDSSEINEQDELELALKLSKVQYEIEQKKEAIKKKRKKSEDPFGNFENQFSTSQNKNESSENGFDDFSKAGNSDNNAFSNFGNSGLTTPNDDGTFFGNNFENNDDNFGAKFGFDQEEDQKEKEEEFNFGFQDNTNTQTNTQIKFTPSTVEDDEIDLMGEFSQLEINPTPPAPVTNQNTILTPTSNQQTGLDEINLLGDAPIINTNQQPQLINLSQPQVPNQAHFTTGMPNMNVHQFASMTSHPQVPLYPSQMGYPANQTQAAMLALQQRQQQLLQQKLLLEQQQRLAGLRNLQNQNNQSQMNQLGMSNNISYNPQRQPEVKQPEPVMKTPDDYMNIDLLGSG